MWEAVPLAERTIVSEGEFDEMAWQTTDDEKEIKIECLLGKLSHAENPYI